MDATHDRLLNAARVIFAKEGLDGLSIRQVASTAGLSPMAMYRHFADKDALIDALMRDGFAAWEEIAAAIKAEDPLRWLKKLGEACLDFALADPHRFDAAFLLPARQARKYPDDFVAGRSPVVSMLLARIEEAQERGLLVSLPPLQIALMLSALLQGLVSMHRARRFSNDAEFRALFRTSLRDFLSMITTKVKRK